MMYFAGCLVGWIRNLKVGERGFWVWRTEVVYKVWTYESSLISCHIHPGSPCRSEQLKVINFGLQAGREY